MGQVEIRKIGDSEGERDGDGDGEDEPRRAKIPGTDTHERAASRRTSPMGRRARCRHAVKINGTIAIYLVSHDNKR